MKIKNVYLCFINISDDMYEPHKPRGTSQFTKGDLDFSALYSIAKHKKS